MRIEQLEYLIEIAKTNSISIAAENLYVSQHRICSRDERDSAGHESHGDFKADRHRL